MLLGGAAATWPLAAHAQQASKLLSQRLDNLQSGLSTSGKTSLAPSVGRRDLVLRYFDPSLTAKEAEENTDALAAAHVGDESFEAAKWTTDAAPACAGPQLLAFGELDQAIDLALADSVDDSVANTGGSVAIAQEPHDARRRDDRVPLQSNQHEAVAGKEACRSAHKLAAVAIALHDARKIGFEANSGQGCQR
jgi:hypothetical protein